MVFISVKAIDRREGLVGHSFVELRLVQRDQKDHNDSIDCLQHDSALCYDMINAAQHKR